ncbi:MAG TPA: hypothetical protein VKR23_15950 [Gaiellaceae bacterium]|nr:hypothetical protein [Gaiellaceae bacterium]
MKTRALYLALLLALVALEAHAAVVTAVRVTVASTATLIYTAPPGFTGRVLVRNPSAVSVYVGSASVTTTTGFEIAAGDALGINVVPADTLYGIVATGTQVVHTIQAANPQ